MASKSLEITAVTNGYVLVSSLTIHQGSVTAVFEKGNELDLIKYLCGVFDWKDVIEFPPTEERTLSADEKDDLPF